MTGAAGTRARFDAPLADWFASRGWTPAAFQRKAWKHYLAGESGLLVTPTGSGKTLAAFGGPLLQALRSDRASPRPQKRSDATSPRTRVLWVTPLRALANDTVRALREPIAALDLPWTVAMRTGDASARDKRLARQGRAEVLVITPESLALLLTYADTLPQLAGLRAVIVDEWHELLGNKRGVLLQLCLARLRTNAPELRLWGLSATLGNLEQARDVLLPHRPDAPIVAPRAQRPLQLRTLLPASGKRFPWAGHMGLSLLADVARTVAQAGTSIVFTNTRAQAELWHTALNAVWLNEPDTLALHHGSLDAALRKQVEESLRDGRVRCVVATSSLDLGVDFPAVDQVIQIGSPKGLARLLQRAGRVRHRPGEPAGIVCVPTHALELAEYAAIRRALVHGRIEARRPPVLSLDVLAQHCVTLALGGGFEPQALLAEVRGTHAFAALDDADWQAVLDFIVQGGAALQHYPDFLRVQQDADGRMRVHDRRIAFRHRLSVGTITSDGSMQVKLLRGGSLGSVEEGFIARLRPRDRFRFAGRLLELVRIDAMTAYVRLAKASEGVVPRWQGGRMPLSTELGADVEAVLATGDDGSPEMHALAPLLGLQQRLSALPDPDRLLAEWIRTREGRYLFLYPFAGRGLHEALAVLMALRWLRLMPDTISLAVNDYGLALRTQTSDTIDTARLHHLLDPEHALDDLLAGVNLAELARRRFRDIARIAGLLPPSLPGKAARSMRQLQASSGLLYDVLLRHDSGHVLLRQANDEAMREHADPEAFMALLRRLQQRRIDLHCPAGLTPLSFPLWAEAGRGNLSSEDWTTRVQRAAQRLERRHG